MAETPEAGGEGLGVTTRIRQEEGLVRIFFFNHSHGGLYRRPEGTYSGPIPQHRPLSPSLSPSDSPFSQLILRRSLSSCPTSLRVLANLSRLCPNRQGSRKNPERPSPKAPSAPSRAAIPVGSAGRYVQQTRCLARMFQTMAHYSSMLSIFTDDFLLAPRAIVP